MAGEIIDLPIADSLEWQLAFLCASIYWAATIGWTLYLLSEGSSDKPINIKNN